MKRLALLVLIVAALTAAACGDSAEPDLPAPADPYDASLQALDNIQSVMVRTEIEAAYPDENYRGFWDIGFEEQEILYSHYTYHGPDAPFTEELFIQRTYYLRTDDGQWYVLSADREEAPDYEPRAAGVDHAHDYYEAIVEMFDEPVLIEDGVIDSEAFFRYAATFEIPPSGIDFVSRQVLKANKGSATIWLHKDTHLPRKIELAAVIDGVGVSSNTSFVDYDLPVLLPETPLQTLPLRDYGRTTEVPCSGSAIADCLPAQRRLEEVSTQYCDGQGKRICFVPLGQVDSDLVLHLADYYREEYGIEVVISPPRDIPGDLLDHQRGQVSAQDLRDEVYLHAGGSLSEDDAVYIGLTPLDLYSQQSSYAWVFGTKAISSTGTKVGVLSTFRMNPELYGDAADDQLLETRVRKMVSKYVGLLYFGLEETSDPKSPLYGSIGGLDDLDSMSEAPLVPNQ